MTRKSPDPSGKMNARRNVPHRHADSSSDLTAKFAEKRSDGAFLRVSPRFSALQSVRILLR
jgi:hypothetical protein